MPSYPIRPTFPIDVRSTPSIVATREGTGFRFDLAPEAIFAGFNHTAAPDADYYAASTDTLIGFSNLTAGRTVYLPDITSFRFGVDLIVADESGQCSVDRPIRFAPKPGTQDLIGDGTEVAITVANQAIRSRRSRANIWIIA